MKKTLTLILALALTFAFAVPAFATASNDFIDGEVITIDKNAYDVFVTMKESASNNTVENVGGVDIDFVCSNKDGWYLNVTDPDLEGIIEVAYKIGRDYFIVVFDINGVGKFYVGDGNGKNGVNHAKVGEFVAEDKEVFTFVGYDYYVSEYALIKGKAQMNILNGSVVIREVWKSNRGNTEYRNEVTELFSAGPLGSGASDEINIVTFTVGEDKEYETEYMATVVTANRGGGPEGTVLEATVILNRLT